MPKVSINILTKDRPELLKKALRSIFSQSFTDYEIILVDDGSIIPVLENGVSIIRHEKSTGVTASRQAALLASQGEYVAVLDDDDEWTEHARRENRRDCERRSRDDSVSA